MLHFEEDAAYMLHLQPRMFVRLAKDIAPFNIPKVLVWVAGSETLVRD